MTTKLEGWVEVVRALVVAQLVEKLFVAASLIYTLYSLTVCTKRSFPTLYFKKRIDNKMLMNLEDTRYNLNYQKFKDS